MYYMVQAKKTKNKKKQTSVLTNTRTSSVLPLVATRTQSILVSCREGRERRTSGETHLEDGQDTGAKAWSLQ